MTDKTTGHTVLIVEDEPNIRAFVRVNLAVRGYSVAEAASAEEALNWIMQNRPKLLILDVRLPGMSGWDLVRMLQQDDALHSIPVIILSASGKDHEQYVQYPNVHAHLVKPVSIDRLMASVRAVMPL